MALAATMHQMELAKRTVNLSGGGGGASSADQISYNNTTSGMIATNVQGAIDENATKIDDLSNKIGEDEIEVGDNVIDGLNTLNENLKSNDNTVFRFANDGEGNYGFLKADDSFVPFKSGLELSDDKRQYVSSLSHSAGSYYYFTQFEANKSYLVIISDGGGGTITGIDIKNAEIEYINCHRKNGTIIIMQLKALTNNVGMKPYWNGSSSESYFWEADATIYEM